MEFRDVMTRGVGRILQLCSVKHLLALSSYRYISGAD